MQTAQELWLSLSLSAGTQTLSFVRTLALGDIQTKKNPVASSDAAAKAKTVYEENCLMPWRGRQGRRSDGQHVEGETKLTFLMPRSREATDGRSSGYHQRETI